MTAGLFRLVLAGAPAGLRVALRSDPVDPHPLFHLLDGTARSHLLEQLGAFQQVPPIYRAKYIPPNPQPPPPPPAPARPPAKAPVPLLLPPGLQAGAGRADIGRYRRDRTCAHAPGRPRLIYNGRGAGGAISTSARPPPRSAAATTACMSD